MCQVKGLEAAGSPSAWIWIELNKMKKHFVAQQTSTQIVVLRKVSSRKNVVRTVSQPRILYDRSQRNVWAFVWPWCVGEKYWTCYYNATGIVENLDEPSNLTQQYQTTLGSTVCPKKRFLRFISASELPPDKQSDQIVTDSEKPAKIGYWLWAKVKSRLSQSTRKTYWLLRCRLGNAA